MTDLVTLDELNDLRELFDAASSGPWYIDRGLMGNSLWITSRTREVKLGDDEPDGPICSISKERTIQKKSSRKDDVVFSKRPILSAESDASLIVTMKNILPRLINTISTQGSVDEKAWLIKFAPNKHHPVRYWSCGEEPVININDATRLVRKIDAENIIKRTSLNSCTVIEHNLSLTKMLDQIESLV